MADFSYIQNCGLTNPTAEPEIEVWLPDWTKNQCYSKVSANDRKHEVLSTHQSHVNATSFPFLRTLCCLNHGKRLGVKKVSKHVAIHVSYLFPRRFFVTTRLLTVLVPYHKQIFRSQKIATTVSAIW
jgi:hypothetical protein